jgi:hypothetical protein
MSKIMVFPAPNKKGKATLTPIGEIEAKPAYYSLAIEGLPHSFGDRLFGEVCLWSPESRFLAVQEWKETDDAGTPRFCVLLIVDVIGRSQCVIANVEGAKGNILPESFVGESLMYTVIYYGQFGMTKSFESRFRYLKDWQAIT